jgi:hypothetical protein
VERRKTFLLALICLPIQAATTSGSPQLPLSFTENRGQTDVKVRAIGDGPQFKAWFEENSVILQQGKATAHMDFVNSNRKPAITMENPTGAKANYLRGSNSAKWQADVPIYNALRYHQVWPGIDVTFRQNDSRMEDEYTVAPGADISTIRLRFNGTVAVKGDGSLVVRTPTGEFRESPPEFFQDNERVTGHFVKAAAGLVTFSANYDHKRPLTIDPTILFSGFFGGSAEDDVTAVAVNSSFDVIAAGWSLSIDLPTSAGARASNGGGVDAFVAIFSPVGGQLISCTYLGGSGDDRAFGVAVDSSANIYVTGWSSSVNFPVVNPIQSHLTGARDAFIAKLNPTASSIVYSTYLGGSGVDYANAIAVDSLGQAIIVGDTTSANLPVTAGVFQSHLAGGQDAFVARLNAAGSALSFLTYFGGNSTDHGATVQIDPTGPIVIGGGTMSTNLPTLLAAQAHSGGGQDGFIAKFNSTATALVLCTYLGGSGGSPGLPEQVTSLVIGPSKNIIAAGITSSPNFPVTSGVLQAAYGGGQTDGFITKLNATTGAIVVSTFLGGSLNDGINAMAEDQLGRLYVTGFTISTDFPAIRPAQTASAGGVAGSMDAFVATVNSGLNTITFSTYLGGSGSDSANAIAVDSMTSIVVGGQTGSLDFPVSGALGPITNEFLSSFITKFAADWTLEVATAPALTLDAWHTGGLVTTSLSYGQAGDIPIAGDWTGSGVKRIGVFRSGLWILDTNNNGILDAGDKVVSFGQAGDIPVIGDWNGTGAIKLGLFRSGSFILDLSGHLSGVPTGFTDANFTYGQSTDIPVVGDWNNTGYTKVGVFRNGSWLVDYNGDRQFTSLDKTYTYGQAGDIPVTGYWDSAGLIRIGVYRNGTWLLNFSGTNALGSIGQTDLSIPFGAAGQTPVIH